MRKSVLITAAALALAGIAAAASAQVPAKGPHAAIECKACHAGNAFTAPDKKVCLDCHVSYNDLARRTENLNPAFNPHYSHKGQENCASCHSMHGQSQFICNDCHGFKGAGTTMK